MMAIKTIINLIGEGNLVDIMDMKLMVILLMAGMLLFGCTSQGPAAPTSGTQTGTQAGQPSTSGTTGQGAQTGSQGQSTPGVQLTGKNWVELTALNLPIECKVKFKGKAINDAIKSATLYMKGSRFKEVVDMSMEGVSLKITVISKDDGNVYMTYDNPILITAMTQGKIQCDGFVYSTKTDAEGGTVTSEPTSTPTVDTSELQSSDLVDLDCKPSVFGDEMFGTPGKYCTMQEITKALTGGQDICGQITDPTQKAQCEKSLGG